MYSPVQPMSSGDTKVPTMYGGKTKCVGRGGGVCDEVEDRHDFGVVCIIGMDGDRYDSDGPSNDAVDHRDNAIMVTLE